MEIYFSDNNVKSVPPNKSQAAILHSDKNSILLDVLVSRPT